MRQRTTACVCALFLMTCAGEDIGTDGNFDDDGKADIYGSDSRREVSASSSVAQGVAESTALIVDSATMSVRSDGAIGLSDTTWSELLAFAMGAPLCESEPFRNQPASGFCSAFLIAPDLVATAGHCINFDTQCEDIRFIFGFYYQGDQDVTRVEQNDMYMCEQVVGFLYDHDSDDVEARTSREFWSDWAVIKLNRPVLDREFLTIRPSGEPSVGQSVAAIGYPGGIPGKVTRGQIVEIRDLYFNTNLDIYAGNSGSVVVDGDGDIEGIVTRGTGGGNNSFVREGYCLVSRDDCDDVDLSEPRCSGNQINRSAPLLPFVEGGVQFIDNLVEPSDGQIPDGSGSLETSMTLSEGGILSFVTLNAMVVHWSPHDLRISLRHDSGREVLLFDQPTLYEGGGSMMSATTHDFDGLDASGEWTLVVQDVETTSAIRNYVMEWELVVGVH